MIKDFNEFVDSLTETAKGKYKKAKFARHYLKQIADIDRFYLLYLSFIEYLANACNVRGLENSSIEKIEYFKKGNSKTKAVRVIYEVNYEITFGSPLFSYMFENAYQSITENKDKIDFHDRLNQRMEVCSSFHKSIINELHSKFTKSSVEYKELNSYYEIDENDKQKSLVKCGLKIVVELEKLNV